LIDSTLLPVVANLPVVEYEHKIKSVASTFCLKPDGPRWWTVSWHKFSGKVHLLKMLSMTVTF